MSISLLKTINWTGTNIIALWPPFLETINWIWINIIAKLWPPLVAVVLTQKFIEMRKPKLEMVPEGMYPGIWKTFDPRTGRVLSESPYHMWRIKVQLVKIHRGLACLIRNRETALRCKADLTFLSLEGIELFKMQGRWASTPEISHLNPLSQNERIMYPELVDVLYKDYQILDCIVKFDGEKITYGWNNESYRTDGKNLRCKLQAGQYKVVVRVSGQNFPEIKRQFSLVVSEDWQGTSLELA